MNQQGVWSDRRQPWLLRFWWLFPACVLVVALALAALHREIPLALQPQSVQAYEALHTTTHPATAQGWVKVRLTSERDSSSTFRPLVRSRVETTWERAAPSLLRRHDDWYDIGGSRPLYQERTLTWLGLVGLRWVERGPAPIYHDIFEDEGWFGEHTVSARTVMESGFPLQPNSRFEAFTTRRTDAKPEPNAKTSTDRERRTACTALSAVPASLVHASLPGMLTPVECEFQLRDGNAAAFAPSGNARLLYSTHLGIYLAVERKDKEPRSPFDADDAPVRWSSTVIRYLDLTIDR